EGRVRDCRQARILRQTLTPLDSETKSLPIPHSLARVLAGAKARISSCLIAALKRRSSTAIGMILRLGMILTLASLAGRTKASVPTQSFWRAAHPIPTFRLANHGLGDAPQATLSACLGEIWGREIWEIWGTDGTFTGSPNDERREMGNVPSVPTFLPHVSLPPFPPHVSPGPHVSPTFPATPVSCCSLDV